MKLKYYAAALFSFVVWGIFSLVLKPLHDYSALDILTYRVAFAAVLISFFSLTFRRRITLQNIHLIRAQKPSVRWKMVGVLVISAVMLALNWYLFIYVMNAVSVNATSLAYLMCPILTTVLANIFLRERLNAGQWCAVGLSVIACGMLAYGHLMDLIFSLTIALSYAIYLVLQKASRQLDKFFTLTVHIFIGAMMLIPLGYKGAIETSHSTLFFSNVLIIAVLFTIVPLYLNMYALKGLDSSVVGILLYINPIISFLLGVFYFHEHITLLQGLAYALIFLAVVLFNIFYFKKHSPVIASAQKVI